MLNVFILSVFYQLYLREILKVPDWIKTKGIFQFRQCECYKSSINPPNGYFLKRSFLLQGGIFQDPCSVLRVCSHQQKQPSNNSLKVIVGSDEIFFWDGLFSGDFCHPGALSPPSIPLPSIYGSRQGQKSGGFSRWEAQGVLLWQILRAIFLGEGIPYLNFLHQKAPKSFNICHP